MYYKMVIEFDNLDEENFKDLNKSANSLLALNGIEGSITVRKYEL